jgi:hypothetical protein
MAEYEERKRGGGRGGGGAERGKYIKRQNESKQAVPLVGFAPIWNGVCATEKKQIEKEREREREREG